MRGSAPWWRGPSFGEVLAAPHNGLTALRLALALAVIVSHAFSVTTGVAEDEPLYAATGFKLGEHAVNGFFAISGFLVTISYLRRGPLDYVLSRALRIAPGLVVATLVVAFVLGTALTVLPLRAYWVDAGLWRFVTATLTTFKSAIALPGVFASNPFTMPLGVVWTLKYEVLCYAGVLAAGLSGLLKRPVLGVALAAALFLGVIALDALVPTAGKGVQTALRLPFLFAAGAAIALMRDRVPVSPVAALGLVAVAALAKGTAAYSGLLFAAEAYGVLVLAFTPLLPHRLLDWKTDLSYGVYLYGWPVQQALVALLPKAGAAALLLPAIAIALAIAAVSWFVVEKPALRLKGRLLAR